MYIVRFVENFREQILTSLSNLSICGWSSASNFVRGIRTGDSVLTWRFGALIRGRGVSRPGLRGKCSAYYQIKERCSYSVDQPRSEPAASARDYHIIHDSSTIPPPWHNLGKMHDFSREVKSRSANLLTSHERRLLIRFVGISSRTSSCRNQG